MQQHLDAVITIAKAAGEAILAVYHDDFSVTEKADQSPLTEADLAAHRLIVRRLHALTPDIPVLSEESAKVSFNTRQTWTRYWLVDPLDGTKEFVKRNGEFTVNIALIDDHVPVLGVVHVPVLGVTYYGAQELGAFKAEDGRDGRRLHPPKQRRNPLQVAGSRSHGGEALRTFLQQVGDHNLISMGSSLKLCLVAEGLADIYPRLGPTSEWDTAAAQAIVEAAGAQVTDTTLQPLRYNTKDSLLNPHFLVFSDSSVDWSQYLPPEPEPEPDD